MRGPSGRRPHPPWQDPDENLHGSYRESLAGADSVCPRPIDGGRGADEDGVVELRSSHTRAAYTSYSYGLGFLRRGTLGARGYREREG